MGIHASIYNNLSKMVNSFTSSKLVERRTMDYVKSLTNLICGEDGQVDKFIKRVLRQQDIDNNVRREELSSLDPKYSQLADSNGTTALVSSGDPTSSNFIPINNNPEYWPNMIDRMNTPFDHLDRIYLQSFANVLGTDTKDNYFKNLFTFTYHPDTDKIRGITDVFMQDDDTIDYSPINSVFHSEKHDAVEFLLDSFTYTPFIDYSLVGEGGNPD